MLKNKTALITGTNRGIGKAILEEFAKNGANIFAHARREGNDFQEYLHETAQKYNVNITPVYFNLLDLDAMKQVVKNFIKDKISIDILVNNAGVEHGGSFQMTPISKIKEIFDINFFAQMELTQLILKIMTRQKSGSIINIGSISGEDLKSGNSAYGISKAALMSWTKVLAKELGSLGIRINSVAPGITDTDMGNKNSEKTKEETLINTPLGRFASPQEIAKAVLFLASDNASFINGQVIRIDGGLR